jgi:hypothetical protein
MELLLTRFSTVSNILPAIVPELFGLIHLEQNPPPDPIHRAYVT